MACVSKTCEMFIAEDLVEKNISRVIFDTKLFIQTKKCSFFNQIIIVYQSFCGAMLTSYFLLQGNGLCFSSHIGKSVTDNVFIA